MAKGKYPSYTNGYQYPYPFQITFDLFNENKELKLQLSSLQKQCGLYDQSEKSLKQSKEISKLNKDGTIN